MTKTMQSILDKTIQSSLNTKLYLSTRNANNDQDSEYDLVHLAKLQPNFTKKETQLLEDIEEYNNRIKALEQLYRLGLR
jgi:predicted RNA-binding protein with RPS1 domain